LEIIYVSDVIRLYSITLEGKMGGLWVEKIKKLGS
jgi:hypothetical protein